MNNKQRVYRCFDILGECMLDIKAVLFDCDGLMFETELISQQIWKDEAMKLGYFTGRFFHQYYWFWRRSTQPLSFIYPEWNALV
mgnify:CR=1 FL=1